MDRQEWGDMLGDVGNIEDDLRWSLFQAERIVATLSDPDGEHRDTDVLNHNRTRVYNARIALAALWSNMGG